MDLGTSCWPCPLECMCWAFVEDPPVLFFLCLLAAFCVLAVSFVCICLPLGFGFVISLGLSRPVGSAGVEGHRWWAGVEEDVLCLFFFCYSWPLGHREASKRVTPEFA